MQSVVQTVTSSVVSACGKYRYLIRERWGNGALVGFVCHNPSVATHERNDFTKTRLRNFAHRWGYTGYLIGNRYAGGRTPCPGDLDLMEDPVGPDNDLYLAELAAEVNLVVVAWGDLFAAPERTQRVVEVLTRKGLALHCLGTTQSGNPRHPAARGRAMVSSSQVPIPWSPPS